MPYHHALHSMRSANRSCVLKSKARYCHTSLESGSSRLPLTPSYNTNGCLLSQRILSIEMVHYCILDS